MTPSILYTWHQKKSVSSDLSLMWLPTSESSTAKEWPVQIWSCVVAAISLLVEKNQWQVSYTQVPVQTRNVHRTLKNLRPFWKTLLSPFNRRMISSLCFLHSPVHFPNKTSVWKWKQTNKKNKQKKQNKTKKTTREREKEKGKEWNPISQVSFLYNFPFILCFIYGRDNAKHPCGNAALILGIL